MVVVVLLVIAFQIKTHTKCVAYDETTLKISPVTLPIIKLKTV